MATIIIREIPERHGSGWVIYPEPAERDILPIINVYVTDFEVSDDGSVITCLAGDEAVCYLYPNADTIGWLME